MRLVIILWAIPVILFWGWYGLSVNDWHFGLYFLERRFHDFVFHIYSQQLGMPANEIPAMIAWVFIVDTALVFGAAALRWYKAWLPQTYHWIRDKLAMLQGAEAASVNHSQDDMRVAVRTATPPTAQAGLVQPAE